MRIAGRVKRWTTWAPSTLTDVARILIWSPNYAPELTGTPPLVTDGAEWLATNGHRVEVVTAVPNYPARQLIPSVELKEAESGQVPAGAASNCALTGPRLRAMVRPHAVSVQT